MTLSRKDALQTLVSPIEKLIEAVSGAIGKAYEPCHIKRMANAKAYEVRTISDAVRNNSDIPIVYDSSSVLIDTSKYEEIAKRASSRLTYQEITKQQNIEAVVNNAYQELQCADSVPNDPVDSDWMFRFFNSVENIRDEDMQKIWGRILAGEIRSPSRYSYRTLETLRNMNKEEALLFQKIASLALSYDECKFILKDKPLMNKHNVFFKDVLKMEECGLMSSQIISLKLKTSNVRTAYLWNSHILGKITGTSADIKENNLGIYIFSEAGYQLIDAIKPEQSESYILDSLKLIRSIYNNVIVTAHNIQDIRPDMEITYDKNDLLSSGN